MSRMPNHGVMCSSTAQILFEDQLSMHEALLVLSTTGCTYAGSMGDGGEAIVLMSQCLKDFVDLGIAQHQGKPIDPEKLQRAAGIATMEGGKVILGLVLTLADCYAGNTHRKISADERSYISMLCGMFSTWVIRRMEKGQKAIDELKL